MKKLTRQSFTELPKMKKLDVTYFIFRITDKSMSPSYLDLIQFEAHQKI